MLSFLSIIYILYPLLQHMDPFGKQRLADFKVDPTYINVNHGSYGYCPKVVLKEQQKYRDQCQFNTEKWFRLDSEILINDMRAYAAQKVNCPTKNIYFVQNATDGINCLAKSLLWQQGDIVLLPNIAYASIRKTVITLQQHFGITILDINFTLEDMQSPQSFQLKVQDFVNSYPKKIKLAIFDHITSVPAFVTPIGSLVQFFREKNIPLFIDGAHAMNQVNVNMGELQPDAYFSNFHKWSFSPKSSAFLYLSDKYLNKIKPAITGNFHGEGPAKEFFWIGTKDMTAHLCIKKGLEYSESFGRDEVMIHNHNLAKAAGKRVAEIWGTRTLNNDDRTFGCLINVEVPEKDSSLCQKISLQMLQEANCFPAFFSFDGKNYVRLSTQIYNQISDYEYMAKTFLTFQARYKNQKEMATEKK